ncbi:MAG: DNA repair protein RecN [Bacilli bacterium]|nr:DNA repair protein RecN [Bacilli bacterium]
MIRKLEITNFAIIENISIEFQEGFTVLTGETGAGKSLLIDSLSLLLGARASSELIRAGEDKAIVRGTFHIDSPHLSSILQKLNIEFVDGVLIIERVIGKNKNYIKANDVNITLADLNRISKYLADIHNQFDSQKLLNPDNYLEIIDGFKYETTNSYKASYSILLSEYKEKLKALEDIKKKQAEAEKNRDYLSFQLKELQEADLQENEEEAISDEIALMRNYDKIYALTSEANEVIEGDLLEKLYSLNRLMDKIAGYQNQYKEASDQINERYYELEELLNNLKQQFKNIDYDPERLDYLLQRESDINKLKRKHRKTFSELLTYRKELEDLLLDEESYASIIEERQKEASFAREKLLKKGQELTVIRRQIAKSIEKELERNMADLNLTAKFQIAFKEIDENDDSLFHESGIDEVNFLIETNVGEGLKNLDKIISGGEASRIMLAFKSIFIKANRVESVIFDEIDTGISGEIARKVALKIKEISLGSQVIAITHMPQVASVSDHAVKLSKEVKGGRTFTTIKTLSLEEKIYEVASLISGGKVTEKQLEYAREMVLEN